MPTQRRSRRIGQHQVETAVEDAVDVEQAIVIVDAAVSIAVHDHVHLGGAGGSRFGVGAVDALPGQAADAGVDGFVIVAAGEQFAVEPGERFFNLAFLILLG